MKRFIVGSIALMVLMSGCGGSKDAGPASVASTMGVSASGASSPPMVTPAEPSTSKSPTTKPADNDVAAARQTFQEYEDAYQKWQVAGGTSVLPPDLSRLTTEPLRLEVQQLLADQKLAGWRMASSPKPRVVVFGSLPATKKGALVTLSACVDATSVSVIGGGRGERGVATMYRSYFRRVDGVMKYFDVDHKTVDRC